MKFTPLPPFFIVRIPKKEQTDRKEKIGSIYVPPNYVFMTREMQAGQIMAIGEDAHLTFPEAKIGNILLMHHFVSGKESEGTDEGRYHIDEDTYFNYYAVTCMSHAGRQNETYGVFDGKKIIPHREFIFLEDDQPAENNLSPEEFISKSTVQSNGGLFLFKDWRESRADKGKRMQEIKFQAQELARSLREERTEADARFNENIKKGIERMENEMELISRDVNKKRSEPYVVAYSNEILNEWFGRPVDPGEIVYCLNMAANTKIEFMKKVYRVVKITYISFPHNYLKEKIEQHNARKLQAS